MHVITKLLQKQCLKEYEKELAEQTRTFTEWKAAQEAVDLSSELNGAAVLYGDYLDDDKPIFLPDFSPNRWDYEDYLGRAVYVQEAFYNQIDWEKSSRRTGLKQIFTLAKEQGIEPVKHIRGLLKGEVPGYVQIRQLPSNGTFQSTTPEEIKAAAEKGITVVIPSKDHPALLEKCLQMLRKTTGELPIEVIVIDNGSCRENRIRQNAACEFTTRGTLGRVRCRYIFFPMDFDFSRMCNVGASQANGEILLFLNDDVEAIESGWLEVMLAEVVKPYSGAVGLKLLYPEGRRIQHVGITNLPMGPVHKLQFSSDREVHYDKRNRGVHNVSAVTGACLMIRRSVYEELGGMSERLPVAFNDVELCFHAMEKGYYNVVCCNAYLMHHESVSRGKDNTEEKRNRLLRERSVLYELHPQQVSHDPYYTYSVNSDYGLCYDYLDTAIRPAYEDGKVRTQKVEALRKMSRERELYVFLQKMDHFFLNSSLKFEVEQLYQENQDSIHVAGYSFVVGSDNCRFQYTLIFMGLNQVYCVELERMHRRDLTRNMPDQEHVELAGFHVEIPTALFEKGKYKVELFAKDKASSLKLRQTSNVYMTIN